MTAGHVLTAHKGHTATIIGELEIRCQTCQHTLLLPKGDLSKQPTPTPPPFHFTGKGVPPTSVSAWEELRAKRWPRKGPKP